jgi:hypothetical protein
MHLLFEHLQRLGKVPSGCKNPVHLMLNGWLSQEGGKEDLQGVFDGKREALKKNLSNCSDVYEADEHGMVSPLSFRPDSWPYAHDGNDGRGQSGTSVGAAVDYRTNNFGDLFNNAGQV